MIEKLLLQIFSVVLSCIVGWLTAEIKTLKAHQVEERARQTALEEGVQALLKNKLVEIYDMYKDAEEVPADTLESMDTIYKAYHGLGGNGTGTRLHSCIMNKRTKI